MKRAFFSTLLYIYLLDPLLFIRGGPLYDPVLDDYLILNIACLPYCDFLVCVTDNCIGKDGMGMRIINKLIYRIYLIVFPPSSMELHRFQEKSPYLLADGALKICMRKKKIYNVTYL